MTGNCSFWCNLERKHQEPQGPHGHSALSQTDNLWAFQTSENIGGSIGWHECYGWIVPLTWDPSFSQTSGKTKSHILIGTIALGLFNGIDELFEPVNILFWTANKQDKNMQPRHIITLFSKQHHSQPTDASVRPWYFWVETYNSYISWILFIVRLNVHWDSSFLLNKSVHCFKRQCHTHLFISLEILKGQGNIRAAISSRLSLQFRHQHFVLPSKLWRAISQAYCKTIIIPINVIAKLVITWARYNVTCSLVIASKTHFPNSATCLCLQRKETNKIINIQSRIEANRNVSAINFEELEL